MTERTRTETTGNDAFASAFGAFAVTLAVIAAVSLSAFAALRLFSPSPVTEDKTNAEVEIPQSDYETGGAKGGRHRERNKAEGGESQT